MTDTHDYERRREIFQWYNDASGWHREMNETTPTAVREAMGQLIRCARQMMLRHADEVLAACAEVERLRDEAAKWHNLLPVYEDAEREVQQLRADLREAMTLLRELVRPDHAEDLDARYVAFMAKHKETL